jgi:hypothetical protein
MSVAAFAVICCVPLSKAHASYVRSVSSAGDFALVQNAKAAPLIVSTNDWPGVVRAASDLADDVKRVTDKEICVSHGPLRPSYLGPPESFHASMQISATLEPDSRITTGH